MKQLNAERLSDTMEARVKHYQDYRDQFEQLRHSFEEIVNLDGFDGRGAEAIKGFYQGQMDVIDAWYRFIDHQIAFFEGVSGTLSDFELGDQTKVDSQFLSEDLAQREVQADEMVSDQHQTLEQIFSEIEDIMTLRPFSRDGFDEQMSELHEKRVETIEAVEDVDHILAEDYESSLVEQQFMAALFDELLLATMQGGDVSTIHFDANAYHNSEVYKNIENAETYTAEYLAHKQEQAHARELQDRAWYEVLWDGTKTFVGEATGYYDLIRASTGVDPVTGVEYTAGQRIAYAGLAAAGFIPFVGWAGKAVKGGKGIYATTKGVKAVNTSLDIYKTANALSTIQKAEMGLYGLAAANGFSEYITGKDVLGNELTAEQRSASLGTGIAASLPFAPSIFSQSKYLGKQTMQKIGNMNLTSGSNNMFRSFGEKQSGLQRWLGNRQVQPAFAGNVPDVPMRVMDSGHINKKLDVVYSKRVDGVNVGKGNGVPSYGKKSVPIGPYREVNRFPVKVKSGAQEKHIPNTPNYKQEIANGKNKSIFYGDNKTAQELLDEFAGKGQLLPNGKKERVDFGKRIGKYYDRDTSEYLETTRGMIHYGKDGAHIVPSEPLKK